MLNFTDKIRISGECHSEILGIPGFLVAFLRFLENFLSIWSNMPFHQNAKYIESSYKYFWNLFQDYMSKNDARRHFEIPDGGFRFLKIHEISLNVGIFGTTSTMLN